MTQTPLDLFEQPDGDGPDGDGKGAWSPLADRMRPRTFEEFVGQEELLGDGAVLRRAIENDEVRSVIFWGPPGAGKTTLAHLIARATRSNFASFSAVLSGVKEIRAVVAEAQEERRRLGKRTILLVDEIHRFNKAQQDAFLPHVEDGTIILIGATTENPSFEVNAALRSRMHVYTLNALTDADIEQIIKQTLADSERGLGAQNVCVDAAALRELVRLANGDARSALNVLELATLAASPDENGARRLTIASIEGAAQRKALLYDKDGEEHYNLISALHKSLRGGDPDASLYWLARMLEAGEDPLYVARRLVRFASEDVGNADPQALQLCVAAMQAFHFIGLPEGKLALAQAVIYLALAPKSNAVYAAYAKAARDVQEKRADPAPLHLRNAPTRLMRELGYGKGYEYAHDAPDALVAQEFMPGNLRGQRYYEPREAGFEGELKRRLEAWRDGRAKLRRQGRHATSDETDGTEAPDETEAENA